MDRHVVPSRDDDYIVYYCYYCIKNYTIIVFFYGIYIYDMAKILYGAPIAERIKSELKDWIKEQNLSEHYVAIIFSGDNPASASYVRMKQRFAHDIWLDLRIIGQHSEYSTSDELLELLEQYAQDPHCIGLMPQLPLAPEFRDITMKVFDRIPVSKDIDWLWSEFLGHYVNEQIDFLWATPQAVFGLLDEYGYGDMQGKKITIIGQSNLLGKPLALGVMRRGWTVSVFNWSSDQEYMKHICKMSDIVISATWSIHLLDDSFFREDKTQVAIDVGRGKKDGQAVGDIDLSSITDKVAAYTPVPWGVGPLTIANLLNNVKNLYTLYN